MIDLLLQIFKAAPGKVFRAVWELFFPSNKEVDGDD
jgi:hypothetical protein